MSQWTHVNALVRIEGVDFSGGDRPPLDFKKILEEHFKQPPEGSEGPLHINIFPTDESGSRSVPAGGWEVSSYRWGVAVTGDLRDYGEYKRHVTAIVDWFNYAFKGLMIREAIVKISVEGKPTYIYVDKHWMMKPSRLRLVSTLPYSDKD